jgi:hypothetical protein
MPPGLHRIKNPSAEYRIQHIVRDVNQQLDGIATKLQETLGPDNLQHIKDGAKKKVREKVGKIVHSQDGRVQKVRHFYGEHCQKTIDGAAQLTQEVVGGVTRTVVGTLSAIQHEANFLQQKTDSASAALLGALNQVQVGLVSATTTGVTHQVGTQFGGMAFGANVSLKFNPATCGDLGKAIKDLLKLIKIAQKLIKKLKFAKIVPGLGSMLKQVNKLGKIALPCVDVAAGASAAISAQSSLPSPTGPVDADPITWNLTAIVPVNEQSNT